MKILIVEDEKTLSKNMQEYLSSQQYLCEVANTYTQAVERISLHEYDCIVLDIGLPDGNGLQLLEVLKKEDKAEGVIVISAKGELDDRILGLQRGADDYLSKPFHLSELSTRIAAIVRRKKLSGNTIVKFGMLTVDTTAITVSANGQQLSLTKKEFELLLFFITNANRVLSKNAIAEYLWGDNMDLADSYDFIYAHIKNLRKKIQKAGCDDYIQSIYGLGYKFSLI